MEVLDLFPRSILRESLPPPLLQRLQQLAGRVLADPAASPDASARLAGQLSEQRELRLQAPEVAELCGELILPGCERWIRHVIDRQPPQGRGPWTPGRYHLQMIDVWLNCQRAGDYNPTHTHGGSFSGVLYLQVPPQITGGSFDGQLCFHGPEEWHIQSFRTGMAHYVLPAVGDLWIFPAWQPHSVAPFRGEGERWSLAFNVLAIPGPPPAGTASADAASADAAVAAGRRGNVSLSSDRPVARGF